jgi:hypothetical protein
VRWLAIIVVVATARVASANPDAFVVASRAAHDGECGAVDRLADSTRKSDPAQATLMSSLVCVPKRGLLLEAAAGLTIDDAALPQGRIGVGGWLTPRIALVGSLGALRDRMQDTLLVAAGEIRFGLSDTLHAGISLGVARGDGMQPLLPVATARFAFVFSRHFAMQTDLSYVETSGIIPTVWLAVSP